jgi:hypothetical protein
VAVDVHGDALLTGSTTGGLTTTAGAFQSSYGGNTDAFAIEIDTTGRFVSYASYLGGSQTDAGTGIRVDSLSNAYFSGIAGSCSFGPLGT